MPDSRTSPVVQTSESSHVALNLYSCQNWDRYWTEWSSWKSSPVIISGPQPATSAEEVPEAYRNRWQWDIDLSWHFWSRSLFFRAPLPSHSLPHDFKSPVHLNFEILTHFSNFIDCTSHSLQRFNLSLHLIPSHSVTRQYWQHRTRRHETSFYTHHFAVFGHRARTWRTFARLWLTTSRSSIHFGSPNFNSDCHYREHPNHTRWLRSSRNNE